MMPAMKRHFFWYVYKNGRYAATVGPQQLTDYEAFLLEERTKMNNFGAMLYRFVWQRGMPAWLYDRRTTHELHAGLPPKTSYA